AFVPRPPESGEAPASQRSAAVPLSTPRPEAIAVQVPRPPPVTTVPQSAPNLQVPKPEAAAAQAPLRPLDIAVPDEASDVVATIYLINRQSRPQAVGAPPVQETGRTMAATIPESPMMVNEAPEAAAALPVAQIELPTPPGTLTSAGTELALRA